MVDKYTRHDSDDSSLEEGEARRDRTTHHHRSKSKIDQEIRDRSDRDSRRRREDSGDREVHRDSSRRRHDEGLSRRGDRRKYDRDSSNSDDDLEKISKNKRQNQNGERDKIDEGLEKLSKSQIDRDLRKKVDRRRYDRDSSDSDEDLEKKSKNKRQNQNEEREKHDEGLEKLSKSQIDRDLSRRVDRRRYDRNSSDSDEDLEKKSKNKRQNQNEEREKHDEGLEKLSKSQIERDLSKRVDRRRYDSDSSDSDDDLEKKSKNKRQNQNEEREKHDEGLEKLSKSQIDRDLSKRVDRRRYDRDSSESDEDLEKKSKNKRQNQNGEREKLDDGLEKLSKSQIDRDLNKRVDRRRYDRDSSDSDEDLEKKSKNKRQNQNGERERERERKMLDGKDRDLRRGGHRRDSAESDKELPKSRVDREVDRELSRISVEKRHDRDLTKPDEDLEKLSKSKITKDSEIRGRGDRRRHDSDSSNSDEDLEKISKSKRKNQNEERESHGGKDRGKRRHSGEEEENLKERESRSEVEKADERARREDNYRRRGTDENYRDRENEKKLERKRDDRHDDRRGKRIAEEDEDRHRRRERDGHDHRYGREKETNWKDEDGKKLGNSEPGTSAAPLRNNVVNANAANLGRAGGIYIPPFKLAQMMRNVEDKSSVEYQRLTWDALRKSINGLVNKVNAANIKNIVTELFEENLIRGRGLFCRSCMKSQMASPGFTDVFSALVAVVNTKFPEVGELLLRRIVLQLKRAYKRHDKHQLLAAVKFVAHLVNQQVAHEIIALELLTLLLEDPSTDGVEVAVGFVTECGSLLQDLSPQGLHGIFERFRGILHEGEIDKRVQFLIEGLFAVRKAKFQGHPAIRPELDLVDQEDQLTHELDLLEEIDPETSLDIFKPDPQFVENEKRYEELVKNILGDESNKNEASSDEGSEDEEDEDSDEEEEEKMQIKDETETNLVNLRRTIYLTIMSSVDFEEAGHKLLKIKLEPGQEMELCIMLLECCSQERTYLRYYGLLGQRFCMINKIHQENFETCFVQQYSMIHRLETNKLRNVAKFFAHLLGTDALPWNVLSYIRLTEEDTTSSSRIFIKILFQELSEQLGIRLLNERLTDPGMQDSFESIFPKDNPKNTRFSINFFTSIGLGGITENLREYLKNMPRLIMQQQTVAHSDASGSSSPSSSPSSSSSSSSDEEARRKRRKRR